MAKKKRSDRYTQDAALEAELRFSPQETALATLLAGERTTRNTSIKSAEGAARAATTTAKASRDPIRKAYLQAGTTRQEADADVASVLGRLGGGADQFRAAIAREQGNAKTRIGEAQAGALGELERRIAQIALGAQAARGAADARWASSKRDIGQQYVGLGREKGLFTALSVSRQKEAQRQRNAEFKKVAAQIEAQDARQEDQQAATSELQEDRQAHDDAKPKPKKAKFTREQRNANGAKFDKALVIAKALRKKGGRAKAPETVITDALVGELGIGRDMAKAAARSAIGGGVGPKEFKSIYRKYGIRVPKNKGRPAPSGRAGRPSRGIAAAAQGASKFA